MKNRILKLMGLVLIIWPAIRPVRAAAQNPEMNFWNYFRDRSADFFHYENDAVNLFDDLSVQLQTVDPYLTFQISNIDSSTGKRTLVISASGVKQSFPEVKKLVQMAPALKDWNVVAFSPRQYSHQPVDMGGLKIFPDSVYFLALSAGDMMDLYVYIPGYENTDVWQGTGFQLLDHALGEYDLATRIGTVRMAKLDKKTGLHPLPELPAVFDNYFKNRQTGK